MPSIQDLRQFTIFGYAIFDLVLSLVGIFFLSPLLTKVFSIFKINIPKKSWLLFTLPIGIIAHLLAGNITPMTRNFIDLNSHYFLKAIIIGMFALGLRGIRVIKKAV